MLATVTLSGNAHSGIAAERTHPEITVYGVLVGDGGNRTSELRILNESETAAQFTLTLGSLLVSNVTLPAATTTYVKVSLPDEYNRPSTTSRQPYTITSELGTETRYLTLTNGWALRYVTPASYRNCTELQWFHLDTAAPKRAQNITADIKQAINLIQHHTGLTFTRTRDKSQADIVFTWTTPQTSDPDVIATAGGTGNGYDQVTLTTNAARLRDTFQGTDDHISRPGRTGFVTITPGRTWILVHEILHLLGFEHSERENSVMHPYSYVLHTPSAEVPKKPTMNLSAADVNGLETVYPQDACTLHPSERSP